MTSSLPTWLRCLVSHTACQVCDSIKWRTHQRSHRGFAFQISRVTPSASYDEEGHLVSGVSAPAAAAGACRSAELSSWTTESEFCRLHMELCLLGAPSGAARRVWSGRCCCSGRAMRVEHRWKGELLLPSAFCFRCLRNSVSLSLERSLYSCANAGLRSATCRLTDTTTQFTPRLTGQRSSVATGRSGPERVISEHHIRAGALSAFLCVRKSPPRGEGGGRCVPLLGLSVPAGLHDFYKCRRHALWNLRSQPVMHDIVHHLTSDHPSISGQYSTSSPLTMVHPFVYMVANCVGKPAWNRTEIG